MKTPAFEMWLEFEQNDSSEEWDQKNEFFNMHIQIGSERYALNVWSYGFAIEELGRSSERGESFVEVPDLLVETCTREHLQAVFENLLSTESLPDHLKIESDDPVKIDLSRDEAIVLSEFLDRFADSEELRIEDQAEERVLWDLQCLLEKKVPEILSGDWPEKLAEARNRLRDA